MIREVVVVAKAANLNFAFGKNCCGFLPKRMTAAFNNLFVNIIGIKAVSASTREKGEGDRQCAKSQILIPSHKILSN